MKLLPKILQLFKFQNMENGVVKSSLLYILKMKTQLQKISFAWFLILPIQALFIIFSSIQYNIKKPASSNPVEAAIINIWEKISSDNTLIPIYILGFACSFIIIIIFIIFVLFKKPLNQFDRMAIYLDKLVTFSSFIVVIFQLFLFPIVWHLKHILYNPFARSKSFEICMLPFVLISIIFVGFINHRFRIMNAYFPILFFATDFEGPFSYGASIVGLCICAYAIKQGQIHKFLEIRNHSITKMVHLMLFCFFMWKFINSFKFSLLKQQNDNVALIYLSTIMLLGLIIGFFTFVSKVNKKSPQVIQLCECLQNLEKNPKDNESKMIALKISSQYFKTLTNSQITKIDHQSYQQIEQLCTGKNNDWKLQDWRKLINIMINQQYEKEKSLKLGIDLIKCRLMIKDQRLFDTIVFMKNLIITYKEQNWRSQYEIFKIAFHIEDLYFKKYKYNSNSIIHILREVDRLGNKFYKICGHQIQYMYRFWSAVTNHKINLDKQDDTDVKQPPNLTANTFNKQFLCSSQVQIQMESLIISIHEGIQKLQRVLSKIQELSIASKQQRVLNYIKFLTMYTHEQNGNISDSLDFHKANDQFRISGSEIQQDYTQYLEIVDLKVTRISLKLATELHYKKMEVIEEKIDFLIPKSYHNDIEQTIMGYNQPVYKVPHLVPLICSDNSIILKSFTSYLELDCDFGYRLLFHVQNNEVNKDPLIIYSTMSNTIQYYNRQFIKAFKIDKNKIDAKIRNKYLNPDEIFLDIQLSDKAVQHKLEDSRFQAQYNCRMFTSKIGAKKGGPKMENIRLSLVQKQKGHMILKVLRGHRMKSMMGQVQESSNRNQRSQSSFSFFSIFQYDIESPLGKKQKKRSNSNKNQDEQIYCKIENPYDSKISNKKAQLSKSTKITLKFYVVLTIFLAMILLITQGFCFLSTNNQIDEKFQTKIQYELKQVDMYIKLMQAYQKYYEYTLTKMHATQLSHIFRSDQKLLQNFSSQLEEKITNFQKQYLANLLTRDQSEQQINYTLKFQHYTIQTDTTRTNLFDIAQNILRYQNDSKALKFLFQNYEEFGSLINSVTQRHNQKQSWSDQLYTMFYVTSAAIFFVSMCSLIISLILSYRIANVRAEVEYIFRLMQLKNLQTTFKGLNSLRQKINEIREEGIKEQKKLDRLMKFCLYEYDEQSQQRKQQKLQQAGAIRSHSQQIPIFNPSFNFSAQTPRKNRNTSPPNLSPINSPTQTQKGDNLLLQSYISQENVEKKQFKNLDQQNLNGSKYQEVQYQQLQRKPIKIRNLGFFGYVSVIGIIILTVYLQIQHLNEKVTVEQQLTNFKLENKQITENIIQQILEAQNYLMNYQLTMNSLNATFVSDYFNKFNLFVEKLTVNNFKLPAKYFSALNDIYFKKMTTNLCDNFAQKNIQSFSQAVCYQVFDGIFQFGVTKTIEQLNLNLLSITRSNSWFSLSPHGNFSYFQQILYAEQMLVKVIRQTQVELKEYENYFLEFMRDKKIFIFVLGCVLSLGRLVFSVFIKQYIYKASKIGIGYFLIMPKEVLLQNEIVDHLRKNDILNRISNI